MTTIRLGTIDDMDRLVEMGSAFLKATAYKDRVADNPEHMRELATMIINAGRMFVAEDSGRVVGMLGALVLQHPVSDETFGEELVWWVDPEARRNGTSAELFQAAEQWARESGAVKMQFGALKDPLLERLYRFWGYHAAEVVYEKELTS